MSIEAMNQNVGYTIFSNIQQPITHAVLFYNSSVQLLRERTGVVASAIFGSGGEAAAACTSAAAALGTCTN